MFNKETHYALRSLVYVRAQNINGRRPGTAEISGATEAPPFFTAKILHRLVRAGFLESSKGKGGGFYFDEKKPDLKLEKVITAIEGSNSFSGCGFGLSNCSDSNPCPLHKKYAPIRSKISRLVSEETIQSLAKKVQRHDFRLKNMVK